MANTKFPTDAAPRAATIYERLDDPDFPGTIDEDIRDLSIAEMEDYFGDTDPAEFL